MQQYSNVGGNFKTTPVKYLKEIKIILTFLILGELSFGQNSNDTYSFFLTKLTHYSMKKNLKKLPSHIQKRLNQLDGKVLQFIVTMQLVHGH